MHNPGTRNKFRPAEGISLGEMLSFQQNSLQETFVAPGKSSAKCGSDGIFFGTLKVGEIKASLQAHGFCSPLQVTE